MAFLMAALILSGSGCGLQDSFRRPRKKEARTSASPARRDRQRAIQAAYVRAYATFQADFESLLDRLQDSPSVVQGLYRRSGERLAQMQQFMYEREAASFQSDVVDVFDRLLGQWSERSNPSVARRRLAALEARLRRDFSPGRFPIKSPEASSREEEE